MIIPIKASSIYTKPTITFLKNKAIEKENLRQPYLKRNQTKIDCVLHKKPNDINELKNALEKESISTVIWKNKEDRIYGIIFIEHKPKSIF